CSNPQLSIVSRDGDAPSSLTPGALSMSARERMALTVNEIVASLIAAHESGKDVNLNRLKCDISQKHGLSSQPKLVDIIAGVPAQYK
ncbi:hypothetical protein PMAYCL1PPCAC_00592, partial [Pristionchus mayeri]